MTELAGTLSRLGFPAEAIENVRALIHGLELERTRHCGAALRVGAQNV